jgi:multidrug efflux pump subunit AcrA (membrane-fusion protein)
MKRQAGAVLVVLAGLLAAASCARHDAVPTFTVEERPFHVQVTADGILKAARVTTVPVPAVNSTVRLAWLADEGEILEPGDPIARFDSTDMEERLRNGRIELERVGIESERTRINAATRIAQLDTELTIAELELAHAQQFQKVNETIYSRLEILEEQIDEQLAIDRKEYAAAAKKTEQALNRTDLELLAIQQRRAQLTLDEARQGLSSLEVTAPHEGLFTLARNWRGEQPQIGNEMWSNHAIGEIPDLSVMEAEVYVLEADAGGLEPGKPARVIIEAYPETVFNGRIQHVDTIARPRFRGSPVQYFGITLELDATDSRMKPGQRVQATLLLQDLEAALVIPRQAVFLDGKGGNHVYLRNGRGFIARQVEIAAVSMGMAVVSSGLAAGDEIALRRPDELTEEHPPAGDDTRTGDTDTAEIESTAGTSKEETAAAG